MGSVFEDMCRHYTLKHGIHGDYDSFITRVGTWWGTESIVSSDGKRTQQSTDIDIVAVSDLDKGAVIGECKFKNEPIDKKIYETLLRRAALISGKYHVVNYLLFSLRGYTDWFNQIENHQVTLYTLEDLYI